MPDCSIDAVITDPPYGLAEIRPDDVAEAVTAWCTGDRGHIPARLTQGFMGRAWDRFVPPPAVWVECLRVLRPGGHLACFSAPRTVDLMGLSIRLAGFEIRDEMAAWLHSQGMPKGINVSKAIDKAAGAKRDVIGMTSAGASSLHRVSRVEHGYRDALTGCTPDAIAITAPATPDAARWNGWNTALSPAHEPIILARKPLAEKTVAANVLASGTGAINVDACRTATTEPIDAHHGTGNQRTAMRDNWSDTYRPGDSGQYTQTAGRWPTNVLFAHAPGCGPDEAPGPCVPGCPVVALDEQSGTLRSGANPTRRSSDKFRDAYGEFPGQAECVPARGADFGGASRFFPSFRYQAKATAAERPKIDGVAHSTVKPLALMRWLVRLVTPPGGTALDPFAGSGTTVEAAMLERVQVVAVEREVEYLPLIRHRIDRAHAARAVAAHVDPGPPSLLNIAAEMPAATTEPSPPQRKRCERCRRSAAPGDSRCRLHRGPAIHGREDPQPVVSRPTDVDP